VFIKRDDLTGLGLGGNKSRNLEFRMVAPVQAGADVLVMALDVTSNSARQTIAAGNRFGMRTVLVLKGHRPQLLQGNLLINAILGAELHFAEDDNEQADLIQRLLDKLRGLGHRPMVLTGEAIFNVGSALAYLECGVEIVDQMSGIGLAPDYLYMASGGKGQAGLVIAKVLLGAGFHVHGVTVRHEHDVPPRTARIANDALGLLGVDVEVEPEDVTSFSDFIGPGYGEVTPGCLEAIELMAQTEGIILDPVYTGKAFAALLNHVRTGAIPEEANVVFVHTGGAPAVFSFADVILDYLNERRRPVGA